MSEWKHPRMRIISKRVFAAVALVAPLSLIACAGSSLPNSPFALDGRSSPAAVKEFDAFLADVKKDARNFYIEGYGQSQEDHFGDAMQRLRPGMAEKDADELLNALSTLYLLDAEADIKVDPAKVDVEGDTAKIEGDDIQMTVHGKSMPGQAGGAFVMKYVDNRWFVAEMIRPVPN